MPEEPDAPPEETVPPVLNSGADTHCQHPHGPLQSQSNRGRGVSPSGHGFAGQGSAGHLASVPPEPVRPPVVTPPLPPSVDTPPVPTMPPAPGTPPPPAEPPVPDSPPRRGAEQLTRESRPSNAEAVPISNQPPFLPARFTRSKTCPPRPASVLRVRCGLHGRPCSKSRRRPVFAFEAFGPRGHGLSALSISRLRPPRLRSVCVSSTVIHAFEKHHGTPATWAKRSGRCHTHHSSRCWPPTRQADAFPGQRRRSNDGRNE